jgi:hypothetical protein
MTGCGTMTIGETACPPLKKYTKAEMAEIRREVSAMPRNHIIRTIVADYINLRDMVRECTMKN